jgi:hypothetical protein
MVICAPAIAPEGGGELGAETEGGSLVLVEFDVFGHRLREERKGIVREEGRGRSHVC